MRGLLIAIGKRRFKKGCKVRESEYKRKLSMLRDLMLNDGRQDELITAIGDVQKTEDLFTEYGVK